MAGARGAALLVTVNRTLTSSPTAAAIFAADSSLMDRPFIAFLCESGLGDMLLTDPFVQRGSSRGGGVLPDALLLEIAVKGLDMQNG